MKKKEKRRQSMANQMDKSIIRISVAPAGNLSLLLFPLAISLNLKSLLQLSNNQLYLSVFWWRFFFDLSWDSSDYKCDNRTASFIRKNDI